MQLAQPTHSFADVLVVGGGFGGVWAALSAAERTGNVVLVDKGFVSRSGASTMSGGVTTAPLAGDDIRQWVVELTKLGGYEGDQDWAWKLCREQMERVRNLDEWGVPIVRETDGSIRRVSSRGMLNVRVMQYSPQRAMEILRERAVAAGARILDKISIVELLTSDLEYPTEKSVSGAVGIDVVTGECHVIHAKSVVLATGPMTLKGYKPIDNDTGDGYGMSFRAGGLFVDMEFSQGGTFEFVWRNFRFNNFNIALANGATLINVNGERFMERYDPVRRERSELNRVVAASYLELLDGRGPIFLDLRACDDHFWEAAANARSGRGSALFSDLIPDPRRNPVPIEATWSIGGGGKGGLVIDLDCRTNIPGLLAAGAVARNAAVGRHQSAGTPTAFAMVSGHHAGIVAAADAAQIEHATVDSERLDALCRSIMTPLDAEVEDSTNKVYREVVAAVGSPLDFMVQSDHSIKRVLSTLERLRLGLPTVSANSPHNLVKYHEIRNMLDSLELIYASMLDRTESRESFYREDYPMTDDVNWLCWHTARKLPSGLAFHKQAIPFDRYDLKPEAIVRTLSPLAAMFQHGYDPSNYDVDVKTT
jgi:succinate dehydrogenase / fumarate reductase flavoprotein subunit